MHSPRRPPNGRRLSLRAHEDALVAFLRAVAVTALVVVAALNVTSCGAPSGNAGSPGESTASSSRQSSPGSTSQAAAPALEVAILQHRDDYGPRRLQFEVQNMGTTSVAIVGVTLESMAFAEPVRWRDPADPAVIDPGVATDLPARLTASKCGPSAATRAARATVLVEYRTTEGSFDTTRVTPTIEFDTLNRIAAQDCVEQTLASIVTMSVDNHLTIVGTGRAQIAKVRIHLRGVGASAGAGAGTAILHSIGSTVLLRQTDPHTAHLTLRLSASLPPTDVVLRLVPNRCDEHVVAEDKVGTLFPVTVSTEDAPAGWFRLTPSPALKVALYRFVSSACGW